MKFENGNEIISKKTKYPIRGFDNSRTIKQITELEPITTDTIRNLRRNGQFIEAEETLKAYKARVKKAIIKIDKMFLDNPAMKSSWDFELLKELGL